MIQVRKSEERGHFDHGWLETYHTFSFDQYEDPKHVRFRTLRVINEDRVEPGQGFGMHSHRDMEIVTYLLAGALQHKDSLGNTSVIRQGEVQRMSAGTGVTHSEFNASEKEWVHLLQIWIFPAQKNLPPGYEQKDFGTPAPGNRLRRIASPDGTEGSLRIHQDAVIYDARLGKQGAVRHTLASGRGLWVQVFEGELTVNDTTVLKAGDGAAVEGVAENYFRTGNGAAFLLFDLG